MTSTIPHGGKGLFAFDKTKENNEIVFKKGTVICEYGGEFITYDELDDRYGDYTGPHAIIKQYKIVHVKEMLEVLQTQQM